jgi:hypothetical protein
MTLVDAMPATSGSSNSSVANVSASGLPLWGNGASN